MDFKAAFEKERLRVEATLDRCIPGEEEKPAVLHKAIRYTVLSGGKRLRPILAIWAYNWAGKEDDQIMPVACALELIHTYSLIHDDLPAMDNDDLRRGKPTCHKAFDEGIAILAGDALHAMAFELLAKTGEIRIVDEIARAIGTRGLVGGQVVDLQVEGKKFNAETIEYIHMNKTASLITVALRCGVILGKGSKKELTAISNYGKNLGLAFQIVDDILDIKGTTQELGKTVGSDIFQDKATYPKLYGLEKSSEIAKTLIQNAKESLPSDKNNSLFCDLADFVINRVY